MWHHPSEATEKAVVADEAAVEQLIEQRTHKRVDVSPANFISRHTLTS